MIGRRTAVRIGVSSALVTLAGCSFSFGASGPDDSQFGLSNLVFAASEPSGYMEYEAQPDATYDRNDRIWVYLNVDGIGSEKNDDGTKEVWITEHLTVRDPQGDVLLDEEVVNDHRNWESDADLGKFYLSNDITLPAEASPGEYTVDITVEDKIAEKTATISGTFTAE